MHGVTQFGAKPKAIYSQRDFGKSRFPKTSALSIASCHNTSIDIAKMVYDWDDKLDDAYRLYVEQRMSLDQVMEWFRREKGFAPRYVFSPP